MRRNETMKQMDETRTINVISQNEEGKNVFSSSATYHPGMVAFNFNLMDREYCAAHPDEVQETVSAFLTRVNGELAKDGYFIIKPQ